MRKVTSSPAIAERPSVHRHDGPAPDDHRADREFSDAMIPHHESAIAAAEIALEQSARPEIIAVAQAIVDSQQAEIDQMAAWRAAWYP
ncbi:MAG: DUF305 domain-containing protein [Chloroflexi bacterium]|nr:DUF305 domain-containing protein [Chloroflexota bacterium]